MASKSIPYIEREAAEQFLQKLDDSLTSESNSVVFNVWGIGGVGKSTLLSKLEEQVAGKANCVRVYFGLGGTEGINTPLGLMEKLFKSLVEADDWGFRSEFLELYQRYKDTLNQLETVPVKGRQVEEKQVKQVQTLVNLGMGLVQRGMSKDSAEAWSVVGKNMVTGAVAALSVKDEVSELLRSHKATRKDRELQELMQEPLPKLTEAFASNLQEQGQKQPVVLILDTYEKASQEIDDWLGQSLIGNQLCALKQPAPVRIVVAGRNRLVDRELWRKLRQDRNCIEDTGLERFDLEQTQRYLHGTGLEDAEKAKQIFDVTKGLPYYLNWIRQKLEKGQELDFSQGNEEISQLLSQNLNQVQQRVVELAACCRQFNRRIIQLLVSDEALEFGTAVDPEIDCFEWLKQQDFVERAQGQYLLDDVARDVFRQSLLEADEEQFKAVQGALADYFKERSNGIVEVEESPRLKYENEDWRRARSEYLYHLLLSRRKAIQVEFRSHILEAQYFKQSGIIREPLEALTGEFTLAEHPLLYGDSGTKQFLKQISPAMECGWFLVLGKTTFVFGKSPEECRPSTQLENEAWKKILEQPDNLQGLAKFIGHIFRAEWGVESLRLEQLEEAYALAYHLELESDPQFSSNLFYRLASLFADLNAAEQAIASFERASEIQIDNNDWISRGHLLEKLGKIKEAISSYDEALEITPEDSFIWFFRGHSLSKLGKQEEAIYSYDKSIEIDINFHLVWVSRGHSLSALGREKEAIGSYDRAIEIQPNEYTVWWLRGLSLSALGKMEEAIDSFDKSLELKHDNHEVWCRRGITLHALDRKEEAIASYDKALEIKSDDPDLWYCRGLSLFRLGNPKEAIASYDKALEIKTDDFETWVARGNSLSALDKPEEAIASYGEALKIQPDDHKVLTSRGKSRSKLGQHNQALADLDCAIELKSDYGRALAWRGRTYAQMQQYEIALNDLDLAIEINPNYSFAKIKRGELYLWLQRYTEALKIFNQFLEKEPEDDWVLYLRSLTITKNSGNYAANSAEISQAIKLAKNKHEENHENWYAHFNLALYHLAARNHPEAEFLYQTGLTKAPTWLIAMAQRDLCDYLHLFPEDQAAQTWHQKLTQALTEKQQ